MREFLRNVGTMLAVSWRADRARSVAAMVSTALIRVTGTLQAVGFAVIADGVVQHDRARAGWGAAIVAALIGLRRVFESVSVATRMRLREHTILLLDQRVMQYTASAPGLEHHERPEHQDRLGLIQSERWALNNPFMPIAWTLGNVVQILTTVAVLGRLHPLLLLLPMSGVPPLLLGLRAEGMLERLKVEQAEARRGLVHLFELAAMAPAGKEVRVFDLAAELERRHRQLFDPMERHESRLDIRVALMGAAGWGCFALGYVAAVALVVSRAMAGDLSVGDVVLTLSLGAQVNTQVTDLVANARWFVETSAAVGRYRWLAGYAAASTAALQPADPAPVPARLEQGVTFSKVRFAYPGTEAVVLDGFDVHLPAGATVAVVGENGAGKTTLAKLLLRFYEPTSGTIAVDGVDLRRFDVSAWRTCVSAATQDFARLQLFARESVGVGSLGSVGDAEAVLGAMRRGAADDLVAKLPHGLDTQLGREFDGGVDLSLGQWQKVAVARSMMREAPLVLVLDEPTASLDAATEHELFERFARQARTAAAARGAVTILVSHRFSTVRMADLILVVDGGRVVEQGTHASLLAQGGRYAELYSLQARGYRS